MWRFWKKLFSFQEINVYLVRHGETEGNVDNSLYEKKADHAILLTENGKEQATEAGYFLAERFKRAKEENPKGFGRIRIWHSPYYRARQTANNIIYELGKVFPTETGIVTYREESFAFEQKAGLYDGKNDRSFGERHPEELADYHKHVAYFGRSYAQSPLGESRMQVAFRIKHNFGTILRDCQANHIRHAIILCHGVTARAYEMTWMRYSPEWLDAEMNPGNCWIRYIHGNDKKGYKDEGYIYGKNAPLNDPYATQREIAGAENVFMLKPQRSNAIVPSSIRVIDPFKQRCP